MSLTAILFGVNIANRGRDNVYSVSHVTVKWNAANVSCASFKEGSEKIALLVNTFEILSTPVVTKYVMRKKNLQSRLLPKYLPPSRLLQT